MTSVDDVEDDLEEARNAARSDVAAVLADVKEALVTLPDRESELRKLRNRLSELGHDAGADAVERIEQARNGTHTLQRDIGHGGPEETDLSDEGFGDARE
ncbi:DUF7553 family protein [Halomicrococcus sp. NG-SE-24]|uniref:DUF7553 family protein n=1 Tax=Halomicrococcus sp. NG-SE-24 TaxID=3436928 RepID=UPI003D95C1FA